MRTFSVLMSVCLLLVGGCSSDPEKELIGRWQETKNPMGVLIFLSNHKGDAYWPSATGSQESSPMTWKILDGKKTVAVMTSPGPVNFEIKADRLIAPNGVELTKVK